MSSERNPFARSRLPYVLLALGCAAAGWVIWGKSNRTPTPGVVAAPSASAAAASPEAPPVPKPPAAYVFPPAVDGRGLPNGQYQTDIRITKTDGPWTTGQESTFDLWFDGDVQPEFMSRGFESPVDFNVKVPEPRHLAIRINTPPLDAAAYVVFTFKSPRPVQLIRSDGSPKREQPPADR